MRENRLSGSEGGETKTNWPSLPLSWNAPKGQKTVARGQFIGMTLMN